MAYSTLFKAPMSRAMLDNCKTETRRFHRLHLNVPIYVKEPWQTFASLDELKPTEIWSPGCGKGAGFRYAAGGSMSIDVAGNRIYDNSPEVREVIGKNRVSIHLPTFASRQTIIVDEIREEPLLGIDDDGAIAEGVRKYDGYYAVEGLIEETKSLSPCRSYFKLWNLINGESSHLENPKVFVHVFRHFPVNIEEVTA